jgi:RimJ/RimL family protein N-acetyltransferase
MWRIEQIRTPGRFERFRFGIEHLTACYRHVLLDASCEDDPAVLIENLAASLPLLWVLIGEETELVLGLASLTDIVPGRHAYLHGLSVPGLRRSPAVAETALAAMAYVFENYGVLKIKAEFEADNLGAKGFCLRMGFRKEGHFRQDNRVGGLLKDVLVYSLPRASFDSLQLGVQREVS